MACGSKADLTLDRIIPKSKGGKNAPSNLQLLCQPCNVAKGNRTIDYRHGVPGAGKRGLALLKRLENIAKPRTPGRIMWVSESDEFEEIPQII